MPDLLFYTVRFKICYSILFDLKFVYCSIWNLLYYAVRAKICYSITFEKTFVILKRPRKVFLILCCTSIGLKKKVFIFQTDENPTYEQITATHLLSSAQTIRSQTVEITLEMRAKPKLTQSLSKNLSTICLNLIDYIAC